MPTRHCLRVRVWSFLLGVLLLGVLLLGGCSSPSSPRSKSGKERKPDIILYSEADDRRAGEEAAKEIPQAIGVVANPALARYVERVGQRLARHAPHTSFVYSFQIVDQDEPNAFALPGGFIFVSRGLLALSNSEDELANVLGHEIVHVARRHASARQSLMNSLPKYLRWAGAGQVTAYGRDQERESDRLGQGLAAVAGYDPEGLATFLRDLEFSERLQLGFSRLQGYMDTHPATSERVATASARSRTIRWTPETPIAGSRAAYLRKLDGLVVGTGAAEGVFQRDRFLHADMGFSMRFPDGWKVVNTRNAVGAVSPDRRAQVVLEVQGPGTDPREAAQKYLDEAQTQGLRVESARDIVLGKSPAYRVEGRASSRAGPLGVHFTWFARDGVMLRLTGFTVGLGSRGGIFANVARSFRTISPRERASIRETRLRIVPARAGETLVQFSKRTSNAWNIQQTAVMNGIFADAKLTEGQLLKIAVSRPYRSAPAR